MALKSKPLADVRADLPLAEVSKASVVRINLNVPAPTRKRWKAAAVQAERPLTDLIVDAVESYLTTHVSK